MQEMLSDLSDNLALCAIPIPSAQRQFNLLNRAKDDLASRMELQDQHLFVTRLDYTVAAASTSETLPTNFVRLVKLSRVSGNVEIAIPVVDVRRVTQQGDPSLDPWFQLQDPAYAQTGAAYLEANTIRPLSPAGFPAMTMRLRYRKRIADINYYDADSLGASYSDIPTEWHGAIVDMATVDALPGDSPNISKYSSRVDSQLALMKRAIDNRVLDAPISVRMACDAP